MNRKLNLKGRFALITSILLLTLWAPSTIYAESNATPGSGKYTVTSDAHECAHCKILHSANGRPCTHKHQHSSSGNNSSANIAGFAEADPAARLFEIIDLDVVTSAHEVGREYVGFAEVDPADVGAPAALFSSQLVERPAWQIPVGFAEIDPTDIEGAMEVIPNGTFVVCRHMGDSSPYPSAIQFSEHTSLEDRS